MDAYAGELAALHGVGGAIEYYFVEPDSTLLADVCHQAAPEALGCAVGSTVVTTLLPHEHELVHAVRSEIGLSHPFIEEGAAEVWGQTTDRAYEDVADVMEAISSTSSPLPLQFMPVAGLFASFLVDRHGPEILVELGLATNPQSNIDDLDAAFAAAVGASLLDEVTAFEEAAWGCGRSHYRDDSIECAVAEPIDCSLADEDGSVTVLLSLDCDAGDTVGPRDGKIWTELVFEQPRSTNLAISTESMLTMQSMPVDMEVSFVACRSGCGDNIFTVPADASLELYLPSGSYLLRAAGQLEPENGAMGGVAVTLHGLCP